MKRVKESKKKLVEFGTLKIVQVFSKLKLRQKTLNCCSYLPFSQKSDNNNCNKASTSASLDWQHNHDECKILFLHLKTFFKTNHIHTISILIIHIYSFPFIFNVHVVCLLFLLLLYSDISIVICCCCYCCWLSCFLCCFLYILMMIMKHQPLGNFAGFLVLSCCASVLKFVVFLLHFIPWLQQMRVNVLTRGLWCITRGVSITLIASFNLHQIRSISRESERECK